MNDSPKRQKRSVRVNVLDLASVEFPEKTEDFVREAVFRAFEREGSPRSFQISVILTSDTEMAKLNRKYLDRDGPTDVLSFPYSTGKFVSADVFVSVQMARNSHKEYGHTFLQEILFLVLHGILHLLGHNDRTPRDREKMLKVQEELLKSL